MKKKIILTTFIVLSFWGGYEANKYNIFPINRFVERTFFDLGLKSETEIKKGIKTIRKPYVFDKISTKVEVACPNPEDAYVIVGFGQSNSANSAGHRFQTKKNIINYFNGKCYLTNDPVLGASGDRGSLWIPLIEKLDLGDKIVVLKTFGVGGSKISDWLNRDYLRTFYEANVRSLKKIYENPNAVVWIQGESDVSTPKKELNKKLKKWFTILRKDFNNSNIYITGTSYCNGKENANVLKAQQKYADKINAIYLGSTDAFKEQSLRYDDCHFSKKGIIKLSSFIAEKWIK